MVDKVQNSTPLPDFEQTGESKKSPVNKILGAILGLLVVALLIVAAVLVSGMMNRNQKQSGTAPVTQSALVPTVTPAPKSDQAEAASVDVGDVTKDLQDVKTDTSSL